MRLVLVLVLILAACSTHQAPTAPEVIDDQTVKLSYVSKPSANGTRCMFDRPGPCSPASSVADLLAEINASLRAIKDKLDEEGLAGTAAGDSLVRSYNEVLDLVYERNFERLVEACRLARECCRF